MPLYNYDDLYGFGSSQADYPTVVPRSTKLANLRRNITTGGNYSSEDINDLFPGAGMGTPGLTPEQIAKNTQDWYNFLKAARAEMGINVPTGGLSAFRPEQQFGNAAITAPKGSYIFKSGEEPTSNTSAPVINPIFNTGTTPTAPPTGTGTTAPGTGFAYTPNPANNYDPYRNFTINGVPLTGRRDPAIWGSVGNLSYYNADPRYWRDPGDVHGNYPGLTATPEAEALIAELRQRGLVQIPQAEYDPNGYDSIIDMSRVQYDPRFGLVTTPDNIRGADPGRWIDRLAVPIVSSIFMGAGLYDTFTDPLSGALATGDLATDTATTGITATGPIAADTATTGTGVSTATNAPILGGPFTGGGAEGTLTSTATTVPTIGSILNTGRNILGTVGTVSTLNNLLNPPAPSGGIRLPGAIGVNDIINTGTGIASINQNQRDWEFIQNLMNQYYDRGTALTSDAEFYQNLYRQSIENPDQFLQGQAYTSMRDRRLGDLSRRMAARGMSLSGNELGELSRLEHELDFGQLNSERQAIYAPWATAARIRGDMSARALGSLPFLAAFRAQRNAGTADTVNRLINSPLGQQIAGLGQQALNWLIGAANSGDWTDPPEEVRELLENAANQYGIDVDEFIRMYMEGIINDAVNTNINIIDNPSPGGDSDDGIDWDAIFGNIFSGP